MKDEELKSYLQQRLGNYNHPVGDDILPSIIRDARLYADRDRLSHAKRDTLSHADRDTLSHARRNRNNGRLIISILGICAAIAALVLILTPLHKDDVTAITTVVRDETGIITAPASPEVVGNGTVIAAVTQHEDPSPTTIRPAAIKSNTITSVPRTEIVSDDPAAAKETTQVPEESGNKPGEEIVPKDERRYVWNGDPASLLPKEKNRKNNLSLLLKLNGIGSFGKDVVDDLDFASGDDILAGDGTPVDFSNPNYDFPVNVRLAVRKRITDRFSLESGVSYTVLRTIGMGADLQLQYLGIPLKGVYTFNPAHKLRFYGSAGGMVERQVQGMLFSNKGNRRLKNTKPQWSVEATAGMELGLGKRFGIFAEPGVSYFFDDRSGIPTIRKEKPLNFSFRVGLSFRID